MSQAAVSVAAASERARKVIALLRHGPFDASTEAGRSLERYRRAALTTLASFCGKGITVLVTLITVPLTLGYLGLERYGMWMTISSVIQMIAFTDLGVGAGLIGAVSEANARGERQLVREYVSSGLFVVVLLGALVLLLFASVFPFLPWAKLFNVESLTAASEAGPAVAAFLACQVVTVICSVVWNTRSGLQEGFANALWQSVGSVAGLVAVVAAVYLRAPLPWLVAAASSSAIVGAAANGAALFGRDHPWMRPAWSAVRRDAARRVCRMGLLFLILQFSMAMAFTSDNIVTAQVLGADAVTDYSVPARLFALPMAVVMMLVSPLWPAYTEAITRGDGPWVRRTLLRSLALTLSFTVSTSLVLLLFGRQILRAWVGPEVTAPFGLLLGLAIWNVLSTGGACTSMLFNGAHVFRFQVWTALTMSVSNLGLSILLARRIGLAGVIWGTVISYFVCCVIPWLFFVPKLIARVGNRPAAAGEAAAVGEAAATAAAAAAPPGLALSATVPGPAPEARAV